MARATRAKLLNAAVDLLIEEGSAGITTGRLADRAGVVQSAFYNHFPSVADCKAAAVNEVQRQICATASEITDEISDPADTPLANIHGMLLRVYGRAQDNPAMFRMLVHRNHDAVGAAATEQALAKLRAAVVQAMQFDNSLFKHLPPDVQARAASTMVSVFLGGLDDVLAGVDIEAVASFTARFMTSGLCGATAVQTSEGPLTPAVG